MTPAPVRVGGLLLAATITAVVAGSCGVPRDSGFQPLATDEVPFGVDAGGTTPTSPASTGPAGSVTVTTARSTGPRPSSTLIATEEVSVYFVDGEELRGVTRTLGRPASPLQMVLTLERGPEPGDGDGELRSLVPEALVRDVSTAGGVARLDLDAEVLRQIDTSDQRLAIAQLVLTLGIRPGIGQVGFSADGDPISVPVPSRGDLLSAPGEPVPFDDFEPLITTDPGSSPVPTTPPASTAVTIPPSST